MTELEFKALAAQGYNRIPLVAETYADLDTPLAIYLKLATAARKGGRMSCLMESVVGGERFAATRSSSCRRAPSSAPAARPPKCCRTAKSPKPTKATRWRSSSRTRPASGGAAPRHAALLRRPGQYFGYDTVRHIEQRLGPAVKPFPDGMEEGTPDIMLLPSTNWSSSTTWPAAPT